MTQFSQYGLTTVRVAYSGRVQGVGFRYTCRNIAKHHAVTGYVKNMPGGSVELVTQGTPAANEAFLAEIDEYFRGNIQGCERRPVEESDSFAGFEIRF